MSEIISASKARALRFLEHEQRDNEPKSLVKETLTEGRMEEVRQKMFEEIQNLICDIPKDLKKDDWETEVNIVHDGGFMEIVFKEDGERVFDIVYTINQSREDQKDGIQPTDISFDLEDTRFNVTISSSANERVFGGIGSYEGVLRVTREEIVEKFLDQHFIALYRQAASEL
jgi:hypothetical protein